MKKLRKLQKEKLKTIAQCNYVVIDLKEYNEMLFHYCKLSERFNRMYKIIYSTTLTNARKYNALKDILQGK